jgi:small subunit ribosomal protein S8e
VTLLFFGQKRCSAAQNFVKDFDPIPAHAIITKRPSEEQTFMIANLKIHKLPRQNSFRKFPRRKYELDRYPVETLSGTQETVTRKVRGKNSKTALKTTDFVNLAIPGAKVKRAKILKVLKNPSNNDYERRGVISKGAVLETEDGQCRVISRPGQDGAVNAILIK